MGFKLCDLIHVRLPVHDLPVIITRHHPVCVVGPDHVAHPGLMRLKNRLKVECETIPEREFPRRRSCNESTSLWCPAQRKNRAFDLHDTRASHHRSTQAQSDGQLRLPQGDDIRRRSKRVSKNKLGGSSCDTRSLQAEYVRLSLHYTLRTGTSSVEWRLVSPC